MIPCWLVFIPTFRRSLLPPSSGSKHWRKVDCLYPEDRGSNIVRNIASDKLTRRHFAREFKLRYFYPPSFILYFHHSLLIPLFLFIFFIPYFVTIWLFFLCRPFLRISLSVLFIYFPSLNPNPALLHYCLFYRLLSSVQWVCCGQIDRWIGARFWLRTDYHLLLRVQTDFGAHPASYSMGTEVSFPEGKAPGAWRWPFTSI